MSLDTQKKPLDYLKIIFRRKWLFIIPIILGIAISVMVGNSLPKVYRSSTLILIEEGRIINPLVSGLAVSTSTAQRLAILREQILGWDRINQLISALNLAKEVKSQEDFENLVKKLRNHIIVKLRGSSLVSISYDGTDPKQSKDIVQTITDIFIAENLRQQTQETENAIAFINDQLELYQKKLKQGEIAVLEEKLNDLLIDSTEKHPMVVNLRKEIAASEDELEKGVYNLNTKSVASSKDELTVLRDDLNQMREDLATSGLDASDGGVNRTKYSQAANEKLYKLLLLERIDKVTARDTGVNQRLYDTLLQRLETAKITQSLEASKEGTRYTILDPARLPLRPISPNKLMILFLGIFFGACTGTGIVFTSEMLDHSFLGIEDAKAALGMPILGAIPKIVTQADLKEQKIQKIKIMSISIVVVIVLLIVVIFNVILG